MGVVGFVGAVIAFAAIARAEPLPGPIPARVERVVDGDTLAVRARIWPGHEVAVLVRLDGVDAPELRRPECHAEWLRAQAARDALVPLVESDVALSEVRLGKFAGRVVARVTDGAGRDLSAWLLSEGHAVAYQAPAPWCARHS